MKIFVLVINYNLPGRIKLIFVKGFDTLCWNIPLPQWGTMTAQHNSFWYAPCEISRYKKICPISLVGNNPLVFSRFDQVAPPIVNNPFPVIILITTDYRNQTIHFTDIANLEINRLHILCLPVCQIPYRQPRYIMRRIPILHEWLDVLPETLAESLHEHVKIHLPETGILVELPCVSAHRIPTGNCCQVGE